MKIVIFTDGACSGNPGPGGWGVYMRAFNDGGALVAEKELYGSHQHTTNNRMEMQAVIEALKALKTTDADIQVFSDSKYFLDGIRKWLPGWKRRGWKTADNKPVKNVELWQEIELLSHELRIIWTWVKGHADNPGNIVADRLACKGRDEALFRLCDGAEVIEHMED